MEEELEEKADKRRGEGWEVVLQAEEEGRDKGEWVSRWRLEVKDFFFFFFKMWR